MLITDPPFVEHPNSRATIDITMQSFTAPSENESIIDGLSFMFATTEPESALWQAQWLELPL
jgi:hypothetical protein